MKLTINHTRNNVTLEQDRTVLTITPFNLGARQMLEASESETTTATGPITLTASSKVIQIIDPNGAERVVTLPAEALGNHGYLIVNTSDANENLIVKNDAAEELATVYPEGAGWFVSIGVSWKAVGLGTNNIGADVYVVVPCFGELVSCEVGDGAGYLPIPPKINGYNLFYVHGQIIGTNGTAGTMDTQVHNVTDSVDMLSTKSTIDSGEDGSDTAATPAVIDTNNDDVASYDLLRIDIDVVHSTPAKGYMFTMGFRVI